MRADFTGQDRKDRAVKAAQSRWSEGRPKMKSMQVTVDAYKKLRAYCEKHGIADWCIFASDAITERCKTE